MIPAIEPYRTVCPRLLRQDRDKPSTRRDTSILLLLPAGGAEVVRMNGCVNVNE